MMVQVRNQQGVICRHLEIVSKPSTLLPGVVATLLHLGATW